MATVCHGQLYPRRLKKAFDKKVRPRHFEEGDLMLIRILPIHKDPRKKMDLELRRVIHREEGLLWRSRSSQNHGWNGVTMIYKF